jgi:hypothetical protein
MKSVLIIIRICPKDDYIGFRCMETFKATGIDADYLFFAEQGEYKWIKDQKIVYREYCGNFLGKDGVYASVQGFKDINRDHYGKVIFCDSDITVYKNPLDSEFDFGGIQDSENPRHFSGQMLIFSKWLFDKVALHPDYRDLINWFCDNNKSVADDTIFSWVATGYTDNIRAFPGGYWHHEKLHHLEPKE